MKLPEINRITVLLNSNGPDYIYLHFNLPPNTYPFDSKDNAPSAKIDCAAGRGVNWVRENFGVEPDEVITT